MTTLTQPTLSKLLDRLFAEADALENARQHERSLPPEQRAADRSDYRQFYARMKDQPLPVSPETGKLLYLLARSIRARTIVEFGTSFGISTLHLAAALRDNGGGGRLIGSEFEPSKIVRARANLAAGGLSDLVEIREGDALETLARDLPNSIDFVLLDARRVSIRLSSPWWRGACATAPLSLPTTRIRARNILPASGPRPTVICQFPLATTSNCRCGWARSPEMVLRQHPDSGDMRRSVQTGHWSRLK